MFFYGKIILKKSLVDFVKPCHNEKYVAIFDIVPTIKDFNIKLCFQRIRVAREHGIISFSLVSMEANWNLGIVTFDKTCVCTWTRFGRCLPALGEFWHLQIVWKDIQECCEIPVAIMPQ